MIKSSNQILKLLASCRWWKGSSVDFGEWTYEGDRKGNVALVVIDGSTRYSAAYMLV